MPAEKPYQRVAKGAPTLTQPAQGLTMPVSEKTRDAIDAISAQIDSAVAEPAPSEASTVPDDQRHDAVFETMQSRPSLAIASVAARKRTEAQLRPIQIDDLFITGELRQRVPVIDGKLTVTFRTLNAGEDLYIKRRLNDVRNEVIRYAEDRFLMMQLAAHVAEINNEQLPPMTSARGDISDEQFDQRFARVAKLPTVLIERVWVQWMWFQDRVNKAMSPDFLDRG
jgi:hypothetical protein